MMLGSTSGFFSSRGIDTVMPCCRKGVTTINMISSTSIISTIGVTLISDWRPPPPPPLPIPITTLPFHSACQRISAQHNAARNTTLLSTSTALWLQLLGAILNKVVDQLRGGVVHFHNEPIHLPSEIVKQPNCWHCNKQSQCSRKQRFRDTTGDGCDTG